MKPTKEETKQRLAKADTSNTKILSEDALENVQGGSQHNKHGHEHGHGHGRSHEHNPNEDQSDVDPNVETPTMLAATSTAPESVNVIDGTDGNDVIYGPEGENIINAGAGDDEIHFQGDDVINAGDGNDNISYIREDGESNVTDLTDGKGIIDGGAGDDHISGGDNADIIDGGSGNDVISGFGGDDVITGGLGDDIIYGQKGNDTLLYEFGHGNDFFAGNGGNKDTIVLQNLTTMDGWTVHINADAHHQETNMTLEDFQNNFNQNGWVLTGEITSPIGEILSFGSIEYIEVNMAEDPVPGGDYPLVLDNNNQLPDDCRTVVVSGLPAGVVVSGAAQPPIFGDDGSYFQVVDVDAYKTGQLDLEFSPGFFGKVDLTVTSYSGEIDNLQTTERTMHLDVLADNDAILFAKSGDVNTIPMGDAGYRAVAQEYTPIEIIVNPRVENAQIVISNIPDVVEILSNGQPLAKDASGNVVLTADQLDGLELNNRWHPGEYPVVDLHIQVTGADESGNALTADQDIYFGLTKVTGGKDGAETVTAGFDLNIDAVSIERIGNSIVVTELANPEHITNISMTDFNYVRFNDGIFALSEYSQSLDLSSIITQLNTATQTPSPDETEGTTLIVISGLPEDAIIDGAKDLGNGAWGISPEDVGEDGHVDIELGTAEEDALVHIRAHAYKLDAKQGPYINSLATVHGYRSIGVDADSLFELTENEIMAYAKAQAVASAGGSIAIGGVMIEGGVDAKAFVQLELDAAIHADDGSVGFELMVDASAGLTADGSLKIETDYVPGTGYEASGKVGIVIYAEAGGAGELNMGDGHYGIDGSAGAKAGAGAELGGDIGGEIGGVGADVDATLKAGLIVGAAAGGTAMYDNGEITLGIEGEIEAFVGIELEIEITIDTNDVVDTGKLIEDGVITAEEAIVNFGIDAGELAEQGYDGAAKLVEDAYKKIHDDMETAGNDIANTAEDIWNGFIDIWKW